MAATTLKRKTLHLPCALTPEELEARGQSLAQLCDEINKV